MAAGSRGVAAMMTAKECLQWGRDQMAAGSWSERRGCDRRGTFNGAATRWPRDPGIATVSPFA